MQAMIGSMPGGVPLEGLDAMFSCVGMDRSSGRSFHVQRELPNVDSPYCFSFVIFPILNFQGFLASIDRGLCSCSVLALSLSFLGLIRAAFQPELNSSLPSSPNFNCL